MSQVLSRTVTLLTLIPVAPDTVSIRQLHELLAERGFSITPRTLENNLSKLAEEFPVQVDGNRPSGWSWRADVQPTTFPAMNADAALKYTFLQAFLAPVLPQSLMQLLAPQFAQAQQVLAAHAQVDEVRWAERVAVVPASLPLGMPEAISGVVEVVHQGLLSGKHLLATYQPAEAAHGARHTINPLGMVLRDGVVYLVGIAREDEEAGAQIYALHRLSAVSVLDEPASIPQGFDLQRYVREAPALEFPLGGEMAMELHVSEWLAQHLSERRLSDYQAIRPIRGGNTFRVTATVADSEHLLSWLRSYGNHLEVIKPAGLRRRMAAEFKALAQRYE